MAGNRRKVPTLAEARRAYDAAGLAMAEARAAAYGTPEGSPQQQALAAARAAKGRAAQGLHRARRRAARMPYPDLDDQEHDGY